MEAAHGTGFGRIGMVVLDEFQIDTRILECPFAPGFRKITAIIAKAARCNQKNIG